MAAIGARRIDLVTLADVESLRKGLVAEKKLAPRTVNKALAALKAIFGYAVAGGPGQSLGFRILPYPASYSCSVYPSVANR